MRTTYTDPNTLAQTTTVSLPIDASADALAAALNQEVGAGNSVTASQTITTKGVAPSNK